MKLPRRKPSQAGQAAIMLSLSLPLTIGMLGLVVDVGWAYWRKEACRTAAESAATAAAINAQKSSTFTVQAATACPQSPSASIPLQAGCLYAAQNGFTNGSSGRTVTMAGGTTAIGSITPAYWVTATVSENFGTGFSRVLGQGHRSRRSIATVKSLRRYPSGRKLRRKSRRPFGIAFSSSFRVLPRSAASTECQVTRLHLVAA